VNKQCRQSTTGASWPTLISITDEVVLPDRKNQRKTRGADPVLPGYTRQSCKDSLEYLQILLYESRDVKANLFEYLVVHTGLWLHDISFTAQHSGSIRCK
jgi:hypothetical protein